MQETPFVFVYIHQYVIKEKIHGERRLVNERWGKLEWVSCCASSSSVSCLFVVSPWPERPLLSLTVLVDGDLSFVSMHLFQSTLP